MVGRSGRSVDDCGYADGDAVVVCLLRHSNHVPADPRILPCIRLVLVWVSSIVCGQGRVCRSKNARPMLGVWRRQCQA